MILIQVKGTSITPTTVSTTTEEVTDCGNCGTYDARCWSGSDPHGGLGCNTCGKPQCRTCGVSIYPDCPTTTTTTTTTMGMFGYKI